MHQEGVRVDLITCFWGLSLNQTIILVAAILVAIDFFIPTDVPTHVAYILICVLVAINIDAHILIKILSVIDHFKIGNPT